MIKPINRRIRRYYGQEIQEILDFFNKDVKEEGQNDPEPDERVFTVAYVQDVQQRYLLHDGEEVVGDIEVCTNCEDVFCCVPGSIYDEEECVNCGASRD